MNDYGKDLVCSPSVDSDSILRELDLVLSKVNSVYRESNRIYEKIYSPYPNDPERKPPITPVGFVESAKFLISETNLQLDEIESVLRKLNSFI